MSIQTIIRSKYFSNTGWLSLEQIGRMAVSLFVGAYVARYLGPGNYGTLSYIISFVGLFSSFAGLGLDNNIVKELVRQSYTKEEVLGTSFVLRICGSLLFLLVLASVVWLTSNESSTKGLIMLVAFGSLLLPTNIIEFYFQSKVLSRYTVKVQLVNMIITASVRIALILIGATLLYFILVLLLENLIILSGYIYIYRMTGNKLFSWRFNRALVRELLRDSMPLLFSGIAVSIYLRIDQVMIKEMLDTKSVGIYSVAVRLCETWYFVPTAICSSLFPAIISAKVESESLYYGRLQKLYDVMIWLAVAVAIPSVILAAPIIRILFGDQYASAVPVLQIYVLSSIFVFIGVAVGKWFIVENKQSLTFYRTLFGAILNIIFNIVLIPRYGVLGSAIATVVSYGIAAYFSLLFFTDTRKKFWLIADSFNVVNVARRWL